MSMGWLSEASGWIALAIGVMALIAAALALTTRRRRSDAKMGPAPGNKRERPAGGAVRSPPAPDSSVARPADAPTAAPVAAPPVPAPAAGASRPSSPARRQEGIGAAADAPRQRTDWQRDVPPTLGSRPVAEPYAMPVPPIAPSPQAATPTSDASTTDAMQSPRLEHSPAAAAAIGEDQGNHVAVIVHYGTDRRDVGDVPKNPAARYNHERADLADGRSAISYGTCVVSIPKSHKVGVLEDRTWLQWATLQERAPDKHVLVMRLTANAPEVFFGNLASVVAKSSRKEAFVFVHGFATSFADAARRTAQMAYDLNFEGAPIFFSWPTPGLTTNLLTAYTTSESNAELSKHRLRAFLQDVLEQSGATTVHLIAHSMGNRLVTDALQMLDSVSTSHLKERIGEVILTAPDIDASVFTTAIAPRLTSFVPRVTLYASSKDKALEASQGVHSFPRIGEFQSLMTLLKGVEVIDASAVYDASDGVGHSYYGDSEPVIADLCYLLNLGERAAQRTLTLTGAMTPGNQPCWSVIKRPLSEVHAAIASRRSRITGV